MFAAYKYVITAVMVAEASFYADRLNLPVPHPTRNEDVTYAFTTRPNVLFPVGAGGRVDVGQYSFGFTSGTLFGVRLITKMRPFEGEDMREENEILSRGVSLVDTNGAYALASNWLDAVQVDVQELEKTNRVEVRQRSCYSEHGPIMLPVFEVRWGKWDDPVVKVSIDGRTRSVVWIRQEHDYFSRRPEELVKNLDKLLEIPDEQFSRYSESERSNLVAQYAVVDYAHPADVPTNIARRYDVTNNYPLIDQKYSAKRFHKTQPRDTLSTNAPTATGAP